MSKHYNIGDTVGYWTLTYNIKKSPTSIGGGRMSPIENKHTDFEDLMKKFNETKITSHKGKLRK